ncbi:ATP-binding protein [Streptomyces sp. NPDC090053]|uniref:ATP-binding protein n=1 Tax=Streptomyces sp. NPDC090053 TaxID=3365932 RepID=UPI0037FF7865
MPIAAMRPDADIVRAAVGPADGPKVITGIEISFLRKPQQGGEMSVVDMSRPSQMRRITLDHLRLWQLHTLIDDAILLVSELVTNAFLHGEGSAVGVRLYQTPSYLCVEVTDGSPEVPRLRPVGPTEERGRGLFLVDALAHTWGVSHDGATTWCTLTLGSN